MTSVRTPSRPTAAGASPAAVESSSLSLGPPSSSVSLGAAAPAIASSGDSSVHDAIKRAAQWLLDRQHEDGYWVGELEGDTILESEYILLLAFLGEERSEVAQAAGRYMLRKQMPAGGWNMYPGGPIEISGSVKAYLALKILGYDPNDERLVRAKNAILAAGGADKVNTFTRFYLALLGQIGYDRCPTVPPQVMFLPTWFPINRTKFSAWSRTMVAPLALMSALKPLTQIAPEKGCSELFIKPPAEWTWPLRPGQSDPGFFSWRSLFLKIDATLKFLERFNLVPLQSLGVRTAEKWMLDRFELSDGLGAIFPPMVWSIIALRALGYRNDDPALVDCRKKLDDLILRDDSAQGGPEVRLQPCKSPVWDTSLSLLALSDAGAAFDHPAVETAEKWLLAKQTTRPGDWS
ncbi:MAG TPA: prenyltransferase/squalene oxidase repeat-containing protein, partial [Pirellulales bacterium]